LPKAAARPLKMSGGAPVDNMQVHSLTDIVQIKRIQIQKVQMKITNEFFNLIK